MSSVISCVYCYTVKRQTEKKTVILYIYSTISSSVCCCNGLILSGCHKWICL